MAGKPRKTPAPTRHSELRRADDGALGIPLANNRGVAWIDEADGDLIVPFRWCLNVNKYAGSRIGGRIVLMHRRILGLVPWDGNQVDHADADPLNNRRRNLRIVSQSQNNANCLKRKLGKSRFKGVEPMNGNRRWRAYIGIPVSKTKHLGMFSTEEEAAMRYNVEARRLRGSYARLNQVSMG